MYGIIKLTAISSTVLVTATSALAAGVGNIGPGSVSRTTTTSGAGGTSSSSVTSTFGGGAQTNQMGFSSGVSPTSTGIPNANGTPFSQLTGNNGFTNGGNNGFINGGTAFGVSGPLGMNSGFNNPTSVVTTGGLNGVLYPGSGGESMGGQGMSPMMTPYPYGMANTANPTEIHGAPQIINRSPNANASVLATRKIMTNGIASTVTSPMVTEYSWPSAVAMVPRTTSFAQVYTRHTNRKSIKHVSHKACR